MKKNHAKTWTANLALLLFSAVLCLVFMETMLRQLLNPADYIAPEIVDHDILGVQIKPFSAGHDAWGYRNPSVPDFADIVTIGDSQTYGFLSAAQDAWPAHLATKIKGSVYNLSLPGHSPVDYYYLLTDKAFPLKPSVVIVGFYLGNDLLEAYRSVYTKAYWKNMRKAGFVPTEDIPPSSVQWVRRNDPRFSGVRGYLAHHSIIFNIVTPYLLDSIQPLKAKGIGDTPNAVWLQDDTHHIQTLLTPLQRWIAINLRDQRVQEGLRISLDVLRRMNVLCLERGIHLIVALIPTKENVYSDHVHDLGLAQVNRIREIVLNEEQVRKTIQSTLRKYQIPSIDLFGPLKEAARTQAIYHRRDGHPNREGHQAIAEAIYPYLLKKTSLKHSMPRVGQAQH